MTSRSRLVEGIVEAMMRVPNLVGDADTQTASELADELAERGIGALERRKYSAAGPVTMSRHAFMNLAQKVNQTGAIRVEIRMTNVDGAPALIAEVTMDDQRDGSWVEKYLVAGDGVVKL